MNNAKPKPAKKPPIPAELKTCRKSIDNIDSALIHLLAERFKLTKAVGALKARAQLPPADPVREAEQIERLRGIARDADLDPEFAEKFLNFIVAEVIRHHETFPRAAAANPRK
jgi:chorismate mutase